MLRKFFILLAVCILGAVLAWSFWPKAEDIQPAEVQEPLLKPGTYRVEYDQPDSKGWTPFFTMEVDTDGVVVDVTFDYRWEDGSLKTADQEYNKRMKSVNGLGPSEYCPRFAKNLIIYQDPDQVDAITGATISSREFKELAQKAFANAKEGIQETAYISHPQMEHPGSGETSNE
jgi:major membrane immunogen (membrane-anchored lipoprotein)